MKGIESTDKAKLEKINKKIMDKMRKNIPDLVGNQWGEIIQHHTDKTKFLLKVNIDERNPLNYLTDNEKSQIKEHKMTDWKPRDPMLESAKNG